MNKNSVDQTKPKDSEFTKETVVELLKGIRDGEILTIWSEKDEKDGREKVLS